MKNVRMLDFSAKPFTMLILAAGAAMTLASCAPTAPGAGGASTDATSGRGKTLAIKFTLKTPVQNRLAVVDPEGRPLADAKILIGKSLAQPFAANLLTTDGNGVVAWPAEWTSEQPVTIEAAGYIRATYFAQKPQAAIFKLRRMPAPKPLQLQGRTTGFGTMVSNGTLDVSLVFPAVPRAQAASMELTQLIGTGVDKVSVYGQTVNLPSNLSVPDQTERYMGIFPVQIDKPTYLVQVPEAGDYRFAAVHAQFDFKKTIGDMVDGKSFFDVINRLQFRSFTTRDFGIRLPVQAADFPLGENALTATVRVQASRLPTGYAMMATTMVDNSGRCVVTDVKRLLEGEQQTLMSAPAAAGATVLVRTLKKYDAQRTDFSGSDYEEASAIATLASQPAKAGFLPLLKPIATIGRNLNFAAPSVGTDLTAGVTVVTLSKVIASSGGDLKLVEKTPVWDLYAEGFSDVFALPVIGADPWAAAGRYRWDLRYGAYETATPLTRAPLSPESIGDMTHVTKVAADFVIR